MVRACRARGWRGWESNPNRTKKGKTAVGQSAEDKGAAMRVPKFGVSFPEEAILGLGLGG